MFRQTQQSATSARQTPAPPTPPAAEEGVNHAEAIQRAAEPNAPAAERPTSRRGALKAALGVAAAAAGAGALLERPNVAEAASGSFDSSVAGTPAVTAKGSNGAWGVYAYTDSGIGVLGNSQSAQGIYGTSTTQSGVYGLTYSTTAPAIEGVVASTAPGANSAAVRGINNGTGSSGIGVWGSHNGSGWGVYGTSASGVGVDGYSGGGTGVYGNSYSGTGVYGYSVSGWSGYFYGSVQVTGTLSKGGGSFKIDNPLDPANKYLSHSFVESPDMLNIYNGVVALDASGDAVVELPVWFDVLNRDFRYQLTAIGAPGPNLHIAQEISGARFSISGGVPGMKVSWQVTGIRQDAWANAHRIVVEEDKPEAERGYYLHPELYGQPAEKGLGRIPRLEQNHAPRRSAASWSSGRMDALDGEPH